MGQGPLILLIHGAGGATHSWRDVAPLLAQDHRVIAIDLPGHGFTKRGRAMRSGLTAMSEDLLRLCNQEAWSPAAVVGHSAGAAVALRMAQLDPTLVSRVVGINAALGNFKGLAGVVFPIMAKMLALTPLVPDFFSGAATQAGRVEALLESTGSTIDPDGVALYRKLVGDRDHVDGVLMMMAQWSLNGLLDRLHTIEADVLLITGENDKTVPPDTSAKAAPRMPSATWENWPKLGHLMHEETPEPMARAIKAWANAQVAPA